MKQRLCIVKWAVMHNQGLFLMMTLDEIRRSLDDRILNVVAEKTGLHRNTIASIKSGKIANPTYYAMKRLSDYLEGAS
jgi:predicted transcriptional regulator